MNGIKLLLFGITLVLFGGFVAVVDAVGYVFGNGFVWVMVLGLLVSFVGVLTPDSDGPEGDAASDDGSTDESGGADTGDGNADDSEDETGQYRFGHSDSRFPPT